MVVLLEQQGEWDAPPADATMQELREIHSGVCPNELDHGEQEWEEVGGGELFRRMGYGAMQVVATGEGVEQ